MNRLVVRASVVVVVLMSSACGSNAADSTTPDQNEIAAEGASSSLDSAGSSSSELVTRLWVKPDLVDCIGETEQQCMQVAEAEDGEYLYFYDEIAGFEFVEGTSYVIDVRVDKIADPPADGSSLAYTLVQVIEQN